MIDPSVVARAVELQQRSYTLLRWVADAVDQGAVAFRTVHEVASLPEAARTWLEATYEHLPDEARPPREQLGACANMFASFLETSFDLLDDPGEQRIPALGCYCRLCCTLVAAPRLAAKKLTRHDKRQAVELQQRALEQVAREVGRPITREQLEAMLDDETISENAALVAYGLDLLQRLEGRGAGPPALALWRTFAWTRAGSPKPDFQLRAGAICGAEQDLARLCASSSPLLRRSRVELVSAADALRLLTSLGATPWLVRHHELVVEAAELLCDRMEQTCARVAFDRRLVLLGASLHDAGKIAHPEEMQVPGAQHEAAGERLLVDHGVAPSVARFCVTHAAWNDERCTIDDLMVALADKLWKGKRDEELERAFVERVADAGGGERWSVFSRVDAMCEEIAAAGPERLARSV